MAAQNTIDTVTVRGVSEGLDKLASDLDKVKQAQEGLGKAGEETAKFFDKPAPRQLDVGKAFERLTAQIDPAFRAQQQMARGQEILDRAFNQGKIDADQYAASLEKLRARYGQLGPANSNLLSQTGNLAAQFNDIAVQLAAGTSPLTVALQQGTQIGQVLGDGPGGARGAVAALGGAFMSLISPVNLVTIGAIAAGGALIQYFTSASEKVETLEDRLKAHADLIRSVKDAYGDAAKGLEDYATKSAAVLETQLRAQMERLKGDVQRLSFELYYSMVQSTGAAFTDMATGAGFGGVNLELDPKYKDFASAFERLNQLTADGLPDIRAYVEEVARIAQASDSTQVKALAGELINKANAALQAQEALERDARAVGILGDSISSNLGNVKEFEKALRDLSNIALPKLSDLEKAREAYEKMLANTDTDTGRQMAEEAFRAAQQRIMDREAEKKAEEARRKAEADARRGARGAQADEDAFQRALTTAQGRTQQIQEETRLYGQYGGELEAARLRIELETAAKKRGLDISADMQRAIDAEVEGRRAAVEQLEAIRERQEALNAAQQYFGDMATDALSDLLIEGKNVEDVFNNIAKSIANAALQAALMGQGPLAGLFGTAGANGQMGGLFGTLFSGLKAAWPFANGGIMTEHGSLPLNKYADGGVARTPQLALFGEGRMPEAYVPLPDGRSIPVTMQGVPAQANTNRPEIHIHEAPGTKTSVKESDGPNGARWDIQVEQLFGSMISEGRFDKQLKQRFGVSAMRGR
jgi:hypothetical protein